MNHRILNNRLGLILILLAVFTVNYIQTQMKLTLNSPTQYETGYKIAQAFMELEGGLDFSQFEDLGEGAAAAHSISYYILCPVLLLAVIAGLLFSQRDHTLPRDDPRARHQLFDRLMRLHIFPGSGTVGVPTCQRHITIRHFIHRVDRVLPIFPGFGQRVPQSIHRFYYGDDLCLLPLSV